LTEGPANTVHSTALICLKRNGPGGLDRGRWPAEWGIGDAGILSLIIPQRLNTKMLDSFSVLLSWVISHVQEHGFHVGKPERLLARPLVFSEDVKLSQCDLVPLEPVFFSEVSLHVLDEGAGDGGREIKRLTDYHVRSDVAAAAQICLPLRAQLIRLFPELSFEPT